MTTHFLYVRASIMWALSLCLCAIQTSIVSKGKKNGFYNILVMFDVVSFMEKENDLRHNDKRFRKTSQTVRIFKTLCLQSTIHSEQSSFKMWLNYNTNHVTFLHCFCHNFFTNLHRKLLSHIRTVLYWKSFYPASRNCQFL